METPSEGKAGKGSKGKVTPGDARRRARGGSWVGNFWPFKKRGEGTRGDREKGSWGRKERVPLRDGLEARGIREPYGPVGKAGTRSSRRKVSRGERNALRRLSSEAEGRVARTGAFALPGLEGRAASRTGALRLRSRRRTWRFTRRFYALIGLVLALVLALFLRSVVGSRTSRGANPAESSPALTTSELSSLKVNELGAVMILRYGRIGEEGRESRSPENFRRDLQLLYQQGYRCVSLSDLVSGEICTDRGFTPVAITFWGADPGQVRFLEGDGPPEVDPRCALGVLEDFGREHPDFGATASFFLGKQLFGQEKFKERKLALLRDKGYGLGVAVEAEAARIRDPAEALDAVAGVVSAVRHYLPGFVPEFALFPREWQEMAGRLGTEIPLDGESVRLGAVFYDNGRPVPSPYDGSFDPARLEVVKVVDPSLDTGGLYHWLRYFSENPERKYVSDGDPTTVTVPRPMVFRVDAGRAGNRRIRNY